MLRRGHIRHYSEYLLSSSLTLSVLHVDSQYTNIGLAAEMFLLTDRRASRSKICIFIFAEGLDLIFPYFYFVR